MFYELATLTLRFGTAPKAVEAVKNYVTEPDAKGSLLGCWVADIGDLNKLIVLRGFDQEADLNAERRRGLLSANPFGCSDALVSVDMQSYMGFPWMPPAQPGTLGPIYEIRTYGIKLGGVQPTIDVWQQAIPARTRLSPCIVAMVALDGTPRFTNIWAYASLADRSKARADAVAQGIWPPKGGPDWLTTDMHSMIALPTAISPLK
jgi:hypothetical protein